MAFAFERVAQQAFAQAQARVFFKLSGSRSSLSENRERAPFSLKLRARSARL
ncbi:Uncharacterized protein APZ42_000651, partial [Daphnia magna]